VKNLFILLFFLPLFALPQGISNRWYTGYGKLTNVYYGSGTTTVFVADSLQITRKNRKMEMSVCNSSICDKQGNLLFYTNGKWIADATEDTMQNGSGLHAGIAGSSFSYNPSGRASIIIPFPDDSMKYYIFHSWVDGGNGQTYFPTKGYYTIVDMHLNNGLGAVISKNNIAFNDTLGEFGLISACRHANGRDWWLVAPKYRSNQYFIRLISPAGIQVLPNQAIGQPPSGWYKGFGECAFSPNGKKFGRFDGIDFLDIFDFDRCSGLFSNPIHIAFADTFLSGGLAFSPNSSKLYISDLFYVYQFNLDSSNIAATLDTVAVYDNFTDSLGYPTVFFYQQLGPDGKIYIASITSTPYLHVIEYPDSAGQACNLRQHGVKLKTLNIRSLPLHPNYFLGADSGSVCDTLHLNSLTINPSLTKKVLQVYPNPAESILQFIYKPSEKTQVIEILNAQGQLILTLNLPPWSQIQSIDISKLQNGIYFCRFQNQTELSAIKFVKQNSK
jgi:hypothetical protein